MTLNEAIHLFARNADVDLFNHDKIHKNSLSVIRVSI